MSSPKEIAQLARAAAHDAAKLSTATKNEVLRDLANALNLEQVRILAANHADIDAARAAGLAEPKLRRLTITESAFQQMVDGLRQIAELPDPVGRVTSDQRVPSGLRVQRVRIPLGVILMIYEARPNVTVDAFALCFKAGNACILKGGREAERSNRALLEVIQATLARHTISPNVVSLFVSSDREELKAILQLHELIDLAIPRGGSELIRFVHEHSRIPMVQHFMGVCHIFVDDSADLNRAIEICTTAKTSSPAACNAMEAVLVHQSVAAAFVPQLVARLARDGVEVRGDQEVCRLAPQATPASPDDWGREFLDLICAVRIVPDVNAAIEHIVRYGSNHTEAILSASPEHQRLFRERVQASCVVVNASTRFNDGFQLGLGAEIGISTSKIHAYGPMGLDELTTQRFVVTGEYHTR